MAPTYAATSSIETHMWNRSSQHLAGQPWSGDEEHLAGVDRCKQGARATT